MLKTKLLSTDLFIENEYFYKYLELIQNNATAKKQKFKTQQHHIIPVIAYTLYNWSDVNAKDNKVNLLYKDHILAHYYLALCAKESIFKYKMMSAINFILGKAKQVKLDVNELQKFVLDLDKYQELYEIWRQEQSKLTSAKMIGHNISNETRQKIGEANSNRVYVNKDGVVRALHEDEVNLFLAQGWQFGNPNNQNRKQTKGYTIINKNTVEKYVLREELEKYLADGWLRGRSKKHINAIKIGTQNYYNELTTEEKHKKCATRTGQHWTMSEEWKEKIRIANTGKVQSAEQKLKNSKNKKGTIHMTNGEKDIMIKKEFEVEYINKGFYRGRSKTRKNFKKENN